MEEATRSRNQKSFIEIFIYFLLIYEYKSSSYSSYVISFDTPWKISKSFRPISNSSSVSASKWSSSVSSKLLDALQFSKILQLFIILFHSTFLALF